MGASSSNIQLMKGQYATLSLLSHHSPPSTCFLFLTLSLTRHFLYCNTYSSPSQANRPLRALPPGSRHRRSTPPPPPFLSTMDRKHKPAAIPVSPSMAQPIVDLSDNVVTARLPSGDCVTVYLYGATVTSWKTANGAEQLFLSSAAALDGSKPIRGGIPLVFPVFGPPPKSHATGQLPQHGFARNNFWEFLGKSSTESLGRKADDSVKLDFGLSSTMLDEGVRNKWPYEFGLVYSVTLGKGKLECQLHVQNKGDQPFEFQSLFHTYLAVKARLSFRPLPLSVTNHPVSGHPQNRSPRPQILPLR
jgi:hypothetical protein